MNFIDPTPFTSLLKLLNAVLDVVIRVAFPVVTLALMYTGFLFVRAQGKPQEIELARNALFWTLVGAGVLLGSKVLAVVIEETVNSLA